MSSPEPSAPTLTPPSTIVPVDTPEVIPITDFRRDTARIIAAQIAAETPVSITQGGCVTAVVLSPERYRGLVRFAEQGLAAERGREADRGGAANDRAGPGPWMGTATDGRRTSADGFEFERRGPEARGGGGVMERRHEPLSAAGEAS